MGGGECFRNEYALTCNLVHFETQSCHIVSIAREYLLYMDWPRRGWMFLFCFVFFCFLDIVTYIYCNDNNIFGGEAGRFLGGEASTLQIP